MGNELTIRRDTLAVIEQAMDNDPRLKSAHTRRGYLADLRAFEAWRNGRPLGKLLVEGYAAQLQAEGLAPNSINRRLAAVRWWARRLADMAADDPSVPEDMQGEYAKQAARVASVKDVRGTRAQPGRNIEEGELRALLGACHDGTLAGVRDAAILALAWSTGARRSELASLTLADWRPTADGEGDLALQGKGDKARTAFVFNGAAAYLADWLAIRGDEPGPLFLAIRRGGHLQGHGLTTDALAQMLERRRLAAGVKPLTWHDFRRSFAGNLLDNGHDLSTVQSLMGHSSPVTTASYDRRGVEVQRRASRSLHVPYTRQTLT